MLHCLPLERLSISELCIEHGYARDPKGTLVAKSPKHGGSTPNQTIKTPDQLIDLLTPKFKKEMIITVFKPIYSPNKNH
eukprot:869971-Amphidinium_carterae.1